MKTFLQKTICAGVLVGAVLGAKGQAAEFQPLFNGKDLSGWKVPEPNPFWSAVDGVLVGQADDKLKGSMLYSEKDFLNFALETEVRWNGEIDSGIMFRKPELQLQIGTSRSLKKDMTCSFYTGRYPAEGRARGIDKLLKVGDWNNIRLQAKGDTYTVWLNGEKVTEYTDRKYKEAGPIGLQIHPGVKMKVEFRNLKIEALPGL